MQHALHEASGKAANLVMPNQVAEMLMLDEDSLAHAEKKREAQEEMESRTDSGQYSTTCHPKSPLILPQFWPIFQSLQFPLFLAPFLTSTYLYFAVLYCRHGFAPVTWSRGCQALTV